MHRIPCLSLSTRALSSGQVGRRRVVVTGAGVVTCLGIGLEHVWARIIAGECGFSKLDGKDFENLPCRIAGTVPCGSTPGELDLDAHIPRATQRGMSLATCYALIAAREALEQARWKPDTEADKHRAGVCVGMGMVGLEDIVATGRALADKGYSRVNPYFVPRILVNMAAGHISLHHGLKGVNHSASTACTTGIHSVGDASRFIIHGDADLMVCGGTEACVGPLAMAGFSRLRALSTNYNDNPQAASRPFDKKREGFVMSEGAGILVLEEFEHAQKRGATILGEILGYGLSGDSHHITAPCDEGQGAQRCMQAALRDANISSGDVGYVNAHATSTPLGDAAESHAILQTFPHSDLRVSSTKGALGHMLGAAGSVEAIVTIMACRTGIVPPTLNCQEPDNEQVNYVPLTAQEWVTPPNQRRVAVTNSFGFGGTNASLCIASGPS